MLREQSEPARRASCTNREETTSGKSRCIHCQFPVYSPVRTSISWDDSPKPKRVIDGYFSRLIQSLGGRWRASLPTLPPLQLRDTCSDTFYEIFSPSADTRGSPNRPRSEFPRRRDRKTSGADGCKTSLHVIFSSPHTICGGKYESHSGRYCGQICQWCSPTLELLPGPKRCQPYARESTKPRYKDHSVRAAVRSFFTSTYFAHPTPYTLGTTARIGPYQDITAQKNCCKRPKNERAVHRQSPREGTTGRCVEIIYHWGAGCSSSTECEQSSNQCFKGPTR